MIPSVQAHPEIVPDVELREQAGLYRESGPNVKLKKYDKQEFSGFIRQDSCFTTVLFGRPGISGWNRFAGNRGRFPGLLTSLFAPETC